MLIVDANDEQPRADLREGSRQTGGNADVIYQGSSQFRSVTLPQPFAPHAIVGGEEQPAANVCQIGNIERAARPAQNVLDANGTSFRPVALPKFIAGGTIVGGKVDSPVDVGESPRSKVCRVYVLDQHGPGFGRVALPQLIATRYVGQMISGHAWAASSRDDLVDQ
jgi:hypothetical protein